MLWPSPSFQVLLASVSHTPVIAIYLCIPVYLCVSLYTPAYLCNFCICCCVFLHIYVISSVYPCISLHISLHISAYLCRTLHAVVSISRSGILQREQDSSAVYGSIDAGKTITTNKKFEEMVGVAKGMGCRWLI